MQFSRNFSGLALFILALTGAGTATPLAAPSPNVGASYDEMMHWLATTDAKLTFIGKPFNPLASRAAQDAYVFFCTTREGDVCGGTCTVYYGGAQCLDTRGTNCIGAFGDVSYCDGPDCTGDCHRLSDCENPLLHYFCSTPGTKSILVPEA